MSFKITNNVTWVGKIDWELRNFHGDEYSTHRGSSYNSYLIKGKKNVLIDTVFSCQWLQKQDLCCFTITFSRRSLKLEELHQTVIEERLTAWNLQHKPILIPYAEER